MVNLDDLSDGQLELTEDDIALVNEVNKKRKKKRRRLVKTKK